MKRSEATSEPPKVVRDPGAFNILTWKCASRHNGVHFFDIWTSKSGRRPSVFNTFDLEMCFAPQRRALFRHLNFQKWSGAEVFCTFWLGNVLRATTACTFSTSQLPKVVRRWGVLYILTWKCASRHNGVQFFIAPVASWLRTRRFSEPTFRPSGATNHWKNTVFRDFPTFSRICIFCLLTLSLLIFSLLIFLFSLPLPCSAFHLSILSEVWLSKLPSTKSHFCKPKKKFSKHVKVCKNTWKNTWKPIDECWFNQPAYCSNTQPLFRFLLGLPPVPSAECCRWFSMHCLSARWKAGTESEKSKGISIRPALYASVYIYIIYL